MILKKTRSFLLVMRGLLPHVRGRYWAAIDLSLRALKLDPNNQEAFVMLGDDYSRLEEFEKAKEILDRALKLFPDDGRFNLMMAEAIIKNGEPVEIAMPYLKAYLGRAPKTKTRFPASMNFWFRILGLVSREKNDQSEFAEIIEAISLEDRKWARNIVERHESEHLTNE